ncbi:MAG: hypothetical protein ACOC05_10490 [Oceanicaulis sp.]
MTARTALGTLVAGALTACDVNSAVASAAGRQQFSQLDADRDGKLVRDELTASAVSYKVDGETLSNEKAADWLLERSDGRGGGAVEEALTIDEFAACLT